MKEEKLQYLTGDGAPPLWEQAGVKPATLAPEQDALESLRSLRGQGFVSQEEFSQTSERIVRSTSMKARILRGRDDRDDRSLMLVLEEQYCICASCCEDEMCEPECPWCNLERHSCRCGPCPEERCNPECRHFNCNPEEVRKADKSMREAQRRLREEAIVPEKYLADFQPTPSEMKKSFILIEKNGERRCFTGEQLKDTRDEEERRRRAAGTELADHARRIILLRSAGLWRTDSGRYVHHVDQEFRITLNITNGFLEVRDNMNNMLLWQTGDPDRDLLEFHEGRWSSHLLGTLF